MEFDTQTIANFLFMFAGALFSYVLKNLSDSLQDIRSSHNTLRAQLNDHKLHVSENYMKKADMLDIRKEILDRLDVIHKDLQGKADKPGK